MKINKIFQLIKFQKTIASRAKTTLSGFSMIEVITVLLVISIGMVGTISLITQSIQGQTLNKNTLIAYQLSQEGLELIRFVRDTNWRNGEAWDTGLAPGRYYMDYSMSNPILIPPSVISEAAGKLDINNNGYYISQPSTYLPEGSFSRIITITKPVPELPRILVRADIYWFERGSAYSYYLETELYDWR